NSDTANVFRVALNCTRSSCAPWTANLFGAVTKGSAPDLDDIRPGPGLGVECVAQSAYRWHQPLLHANSRRDIHRSWERVVRRLRHVHMVIRMHRLMAAERLAGDLRAAVRDHLVDVHVELRA